jgi:hypothetical protein
MKADTSLNVKPSINANTTEINNIKLVISTNIKPKLTELETKISREITELETKMDASVDGKITQSEAKMEGK